jgi:methionyl-tRNA formyltransferase
VEEAAPVRILFWGTPEFAVPSLRALLGEGHELVGVVTQPDRPAGRGRLVRSSPVKRLAEEEGLPVLQPERARTDEFLADIRALAPELSIVVAYGQILRRDVLAVPPQGSINVHASLLPDLRGAAPISHAIMAGYEVTGITIMQMVEAMDAGPIPYQVSEPIGEDETATELASRLSEIGAESLIEALAMIELGATEPGHQDDALATFAPRLQRETAHVDWHGTALAVARQLRALDELPGAWVNWQGQEQAVPGPRWRILTMPTGRPERGRCCACANGSG